MFVYCTCAYRAFLDDPVEHDDRFGILLPDHEPKVAAGVPEGTLGPTKKKKKLLMRLYDGTKSVGSHLQFK